MLHVKSPAFTDSTIHIDATSSNVSQRLDFRAAGTLTARLYDDSSSFQVNAVANKSLRFKTNDTEVARFDTSGNLLVGTTDTQPPTNSDVSGIALRSDGKIAASRSNGIAGDFNNNSEGNIVWFRKNGTVVATVSTRTGGGDAPYFSGYTNADTGIAFSNARMYPVTSSGVVANGTRDLGNTDARWGNLWLSGGVYLGGTGSANKLDDYEEGTWTPIMKDGSVGAVITLNVAYGFYTKIGRLVYVNGYVDRSDSTAYSSTLLLSNLPFTSGSNTGNLSMMGGAWADYASATDQTALIYMGQGSSQITFKEHNTSNYWTSNQFENGRPIYYSFQYWTNS